MTDKKIPDAEVVSEEKHDNPQKPIPVEVIEAPAQNDEPAGPVKIRITTNSRHRLKADVYEIDDDGIIDIVISDPDTN